MVNINSLLTKLYSLKQSYTTKTLEKITELCQFLYNPHLNYPTIHIAGTNGKGSICSMLASVLQESGYRVGLYTSPHIFKFNERIKINGQCINDNEIVKIYNMIDALAEDINASFFDITTTIAFKHFYDKKVDIAIIETGLGGRYDSTNIVTPILSIITNISTDHTDILGNELIDIIEEKAGIIKSDIPVIIQDTNPHILEHLIKHANELKAPYYVTYNFPYIEFIEYKKNDDNAYKLIYSIANDDGIVRFRTEEEVFFTDSIVRDISLTRRSCSLIGRHQLENIKLIWFASLFIQFSGFNIKKGCLGIGIENVTKNTGIDCRIKDISTNETPIILDVAHNSESISSLVKTLNEIYKNTKWNIVFGVMKDKSIKHILELLAPICNQLILPKLNLERAASPEEIKTIAEQIGIKNIQIKANISDACAIIRTEDLPAVVCGSFYIMEDAITTLK